MLSREVISGLFLRALIFTVITATACVELSTIHFDDDKRAATAIVGKFHELLSDEKYDDIFELSSEKIKAAHSKDEFVYRLKELRQRAGRVIDKKLISSDIKVEASYRVVHFTYQTEFENENTFEEFDCLVTGNRVVIDYYGQPENVKSP